MEIAPGLHSLGKKRGREHAFLAESEGATLIDTMET